jgi:ribosomal protein S18 acetylase RimI-like enzyme
MEPLKPEDADELAELEMWLFGDTCMNETSLRAEIEAGEGLCMRDDDGKIIAYILCRQTNHWFDVLRVGVTPKHQKQGLGSKLFDEMISERCASMLTVKKTNTPALKLYLSRGFVISGELNEDAWVMTRR